MQLTVTTIIFGLPTGQRTSHVCLTLPVATLTVQELIAYKVRQEVEECLHHQRPGVSGEYLHTRRTAPGHYPQLSWSAWDSLRTRSRGPSRHLAPALI